MDERRRRRLAVNGDGTGTETADPGEEKSLPDCVAAELCAASPWIPLSRWKLWSLAGLLLTGLIAVAAMVYQTPAFRPELVPALDPLFRGEEPKLVVYLETMFWTLSGQLALLVGWHRSRSRLDFRGRYRVWPWAAAVMFFAGLCAATNLHIGLGAVIDELGVYEQYRPQIGWMLPAICVMLPLWMLMDRDVRRSLASLILLRIALLTFLSGVFVGLYGKSWIDKSIVPLAQQACGLFGSAFLMLALWVQGWYVAYVTPDPPAATPFRLPSFKLNLFGWLFGWMGWLFKRRAAVAEAAPKKRKKPEEGTATKRKRKTKRTPTKRRPKVMEEEEEVAEEEEEEVSEESEEQYEDEETESAEDEYDEQDEDEEEETRPSRVTAPAKSNASMSQPRTQDNRFAAQSAAKPTNNAASSSSDQDDDDDEEGDGETWRVDGPSQEQLKGLSKKQRRAMIKQHRDQQRNQR